MLDIQAIEAYLAETLTTSPTFIHRVLEGYLEDPFTRPVAAKWARSHNARLAAIRSVAPTQASSP